MSRAIALVPSFLAALASCGALPTHGNEPYRTIAIRDMVAPGTGGATFDIPGGTYSLNNLGEIVFQARIKGSAVGPNRNGIWAYRSSKLELIARHGEPTVGIPQAIYAIGSTDQVPLLNDQSAVAFRTNWIGPEGDGSGIWKEVAGELQLVARVGGSAPGIPDEGTFWFLGQDPAFNNRGELAFFGDAGPFGETDGIWTDVGGELRPVALVGFPIPGVTPQATYLEVFNPALSDSGEVGFFAEVRDNVNRFSAFVERSNGLERIVWSGDQAPEQPLGDFFSRPSIPALNTLGDVAFSAYLSDAPTENGMANSIWWKTGESLEAVALAGEQAPGTPEGIRFEGFLNPVTNDAGDVAFMAFLEGPDIDSFNELGIWRWREGQLELIARQGDPAPGAPEGTVLYNIRRSQDDVGPELNEHGDIVFSATLSGPDVPFQSDGIWVQPLGGEVKLIAREDGTIPLSPMEDRHVSHLAFVRGAGPDDGRARALNDLGQVAFKARLDGVGGPHALIIANAPRSVPAGENVTSSVRPRSAMIGGVDVTFASVAEEGELLTDYFQLESAEALADVLPAEALTAIDFALPSGNLQLWRVNFSGVAMGDADITLGYDAAQTMSPVVLHTFSNGEWSRSANQLFDPGAGTISLSATKMSSAIFLLAIPEPAAWTLALVIVAVLVIHRNLARGR